jgi:hypothetical protein
MGLIVDNAAGQPRSRDVGRFIPGVSYSPATQFRKGERRSRVTEFKPGRPAHNKLLVGAVRIRKETHTGLERAWVKVAEPNVWKKRAVVVWQSIHGPLPCGYVVHHKNRDSLDDDPDNLEALTRAAHAEAHREELSAWRA